MRTQRAGARLHFPNPAPRRVKTLAGAVLALAVLTAGGLSALAEDSLVAMVKRVKPAIVTVVAYNPDKAMPSLGTGFFVAPNQVASVRHIFAGATRAEVRTAAGETFLVAGILAEDRDQDISLFQIAKAPAKPTLLPIAPERPEVGEKVFLIGCPLGLEWSVSDGVVSAFRDVPRAGTVIQHTVQVSPGSSGGPLINARGQVVAIQTAMLTEGKRTISAGQGLNFAVLSQRILSFKPGKLRTLSECVKDVPADWVPPITRGIDGVSLGFFTRENFKEALAYFEDDVRRFPDDGDVHFRLALCREKVGQIEPALESYKKAVALKSDVGVALGNMGAIYNRQGKYPLAVDVLTKACQADPKLVEAPASLAYAYFHLRQYPQTIEAANKALALKADHVEARYRLALAYYYLGQKDKAMDQYRALLNYSSQRAEQLKNQLDRPLPTTRPTTRPATRTK